MKPAPPDKQLPGWIPYMIGVLLVSLLGLVLVPTDTEEARVVLVVAVVLVLVPLTVIWARAGGRQA